MDHRATYLSRRIDNHTLANENKMPTTKKQKTEDLQEQANQAFAKLDTPVYVNNSFVTGSNWDVRFAFCERLPPGSIVPRVGIVMSHQQAKALLEALALTIAQIEIIMGAPIRHEAANPKAALPARSSRKSLQ